MAFITTEELCRLLAGAGNPPLTKPRVTQLEREGLPKSGRDQWDAAKCMYWYIGKLRRSVKARQTENDDGSRSSVEEERKRLIRTQADSAEIELAKARGECMAVADHERILSDLIQTTAATVRSVAPRVAPDLVGETSRTMIQAKLEKAHDEALIHLSKIVPRTSAQPTPDDPEIKPARKGKATKPAKKTPKRKAAAKKSA